MLLLPTLRQSKFLFLHADCGGPVRDAEAKYLGLSLVAGDGGEPATLVLRVLGVNDLDCGRGFDEDDEDGGGGEAAEDAVAADPHGALPIQLLSRLTLNKTNSGGGGGNLPACLRPRPSVRTGLRAGAPRSTFLFPRARVLSCPDEWQRVGLSEKRAFRCANSFPVILGPLVTDPVILVTHVSSFNVRQCMDPILHPLSLLNVLI